MVLALLMFCAALGSAQERVYVVQALGENLGMIDLVSGSVNSNVLELGALANGINSDGSKLYVTSSQDLEVISSSTNQTLSNIALTGCAGTWASALLSEDSIAVTCSLSDQVFVARRSTGQVVDSIAVGNAPQGILVSGGRLYVSLTRLEFPDYGQGLVMIYNARTLQFIDSIATSMNPQYMAIDPFGRLHVVCTGNYGDVPGEIVVFNAGSLQFIARIRVGGTPATVAFSNAYAFVPAGGWSGHGLVYRYRLQDFGIERGAENPIETAQGAGDIVVRENGEFLVSCFQDDVIERRAQDGTFLQSYPVGDGPGYMAGIGTMAFVDEPRVVAGDFRILNAYPNPFNGVLTVELGGRLKGNSKVLFYNSLGRLVDEAVILPGETSVLWNPGSSGLSSGNYWIKIGGSEEVLGQRVVYLR